MGKLNFNMRFIIGFALCLMPIFSLSCPFRVLKQAHKELEKAMIEDINKSYWNDSEIRSLRESKWWKNVPYSKNDTFIVCMGSNDIGDSYVEIFNDETCFYINDANKLCTREYSLDFGSQYEIFLRNLYYSWDKELFKNVEAALNCNLECSYIVLFRILVSKKKIIEIDYSTLKGMNSPILEEWWFNAKYLKHQNVIEIEDFIKSAK